MTAFVIAGSAHAAALRRRLEHDPLVKVFAESESLEALRMVLENPPKVLALDSAVVKTARGALIVARLKEHKGVDVRVLCEDEGNLPVILSQQDIALHAASQPLEGCGTRGAKRFPMKADMEVVVDGERSREFDQLTLERDSIVFMPLHWVIVHPITERSPMHGLTKEALAASEPEFICMLTADDETFAQTVHARTSYDIEDIVWGARFTDMYTADVDHVSIDLRRLHDFQRVDPPAIL